MKRGDQGHVGYQRTVERLYRRDGDSLYFMAIWLHLWTLAFWETVDFPFDPLKVMLSADGSTAAKFITVSRTAEPSGEP